MRADADEAARWFTARGIVPPVIPLMQGAARVLGGDLDGGDALFADALSVEGIVGTPEVLAVAACERSLVAMAHSDWNSAGTLAGQARALSQPGNGESFATPWSAPRKPGWPSTGAMSLRPAVNWSGRSGCGRC